MNEQSDINSGQEGFIPSLRDRKLTDKDILWINEVENATDSLETAVQFLHRQDNLKWKWIAIALHHSLYSFCIAALVCENYTNVLQKGKNEDNGRFCKIGDNWKKSKTVPRSTKPNEPRYTIQWEDTDEKPPEIDRKQMKKENLLKIKKRGYRLIGFWTALARVQDPVLWMGCLIHSQALTLSGSQWESITWLHEAVRNNLIHFVPMLFVIPISDIKTACKDVLDVIEFLTFKSNQILYRDEKQEEKIAEAIKRLRQSL